MKICFGCMEQYEDEFTMCPHCGYEEGTPPALGTYMEPGNILQDRYVVGCALGHGGFSVTYIAWDTILQAKVAVKEYLPSELATRSPGQTQLTVFSGKQGEDFAYGKQKFLDEAKRLAELDKEPGIVHIFNSFAENETAYLVMEYLEGETLAAYLSRTGKLDPAEAIRMLEPLMLSLQHVHDSGMIHRDISPDNIMVLPNGTLKLIDFGAARHAVADRSKSMTVVIKDGYSPKEQYISHSIQGPAADVYALAATIYQMMTGVVPPTATERSQSKKDPLIGPDKLNKKITHPQRIALLNALNIQPENRTQTVLELSEQLHAKTAAGRLRDAKRNRPVLDWPLWAKLTAGGAAVVLAASAIVFFATLPKAETPDNTTLVPNIVNLSTTDAKVAAEDAVLSLQITDADYDEGIVRDHILTQDPGVGTSLEKLSILHATASLGKERTARPVEDQVGKTTQDAIDALLEQGISADHIEIQKTYSDTDMEGTVSQQNVPTGAFPELSSQIVLTVSMGRENDTIDREKTFVVSDYVGMDYAKVKAQLIDADVYLAKSSTEYHDSIPYGHILRQYPAAGETISLGDAVFVVVSLGTEKTPVPDVVYKPKAEAIRLLAENGLGYSITNVLHDTIAKGHVTAQAPTSGVVTNFGAAVALDISADTAGKEELPPVALSFDKTELTMHKGDTVTLTVDITGAEAADIVWATSRSKVAQVDNGSITAKRPGTTMVTAVAGGAVAKCYVTVIDETEFAMVDSLLLDVGDKVDLGSALDTEILPHVYWVSSKTAVATVDGDGVVIAAAEGNAVVSATYAGTVVKCRFRVVDPSRYAKIDRADIYTHVDEAKKTLSAADVRYSVTELYNDKYDKGYVYNFKYTGYSDTDTFRIDKTKDTVLYASLGKATVSKIEVKTKPTKTVYYTGEKLDTAGLTLTAVYTDGTRQTVDSGFQASADLSSAGEKTVTITYGGQKTTCTITVKDRIILVSGVSVSPATVTMVRGESKTLTIAVSPGNATDKTVTLRTSDASVVQVNGFTVTGTKVGTATVTATSANGKTASCTVTVAAPAVSAVQLSNKSISLIAGKTHTLVAKVTPADAAYNAITWSSADPKVATVTSSGRITAVAAGTTQITAQVGDKKDTCTVTVTIPVQSISLPGKQTATVGSTYSVTPTWNPSNADDQSFTLKTNDSNILSIQGHSYTALRPGVATITVTASNGKQASCEITVLGDAKLTLVQQPTKTTYYLGDALDTSGLKLGYTDAKGEYSVITRDFMVSGYDKNTTGTQTLYVTYKTLVVPFTIVVKTPSIVLRKMPFQNTLMLAAQTEPADQKYTIMSSNPNVFTISSYLGSYIVIPVEDGTAEAYVSMVYNGTTYSDAVPIMIQNVEKESNYSLTIYHHHYDNEYSIYTIESDIPNFDAENVKWSCSADCDVTIEKGELIVYDANRYSYTVTAVYYVGTTPIEATYTYRYKDDTIVNFY